MTTLLLLIGLLLLLAGGAALVQGASGIAARYGVSPLIVGLTIVAFGTSAPELVVNLVGAFRGETELAFGNVAGSNLANLGLVLGLAAVVSPMTIQGQVVRRELPLLLLATAVLLVMTLDGPLTGTPAELSRSDAVILLLLLTVFIYMSASDLMSDQMDPLVAEMHDMESVVPMATEAGQMDWYYVAGGVIGLGVGGHMTVVYGAELATMLGLSPVVVGMLIVAVGTSMPELVTSVIAATRNESDLCVGNVIGSNIFNGLFVLPSSALVRTLPVPEGGAIDIFMSFVFAAVIVLVFIFGGGRLGRPVGLMLLAGYFFYMSQRVLF